MAEDAERRMERLVFGVSPPTMTASSAGPTFGVQGNLASIDWHGIGPKKASLSGTSAGPPRPAVSTSTAAASGSSSHRLLCRPWDCGDLLRRLGTFKLSSWNQKPQVIGPAVCARKGWVNVDVDVIACEGCETHLSFAVPQLSQLEAEAAAGSFREQLEAGHKASCPWKGNACADSLAQFPTSPVIALIGGYNDRCDALLQLPALPLVSAFAIDQMKLSRGPQIDRMLSQPPAIPVFNFGDGMGAESSCSAFYKTQRIISLCGWEARLLPHPADFEDHSAQSTRNPCSVGPSTASHKRGKRSSMLYTRVEKEEESKGVRRNKMAASDPRCSAASALLECNYCGANVNVSCFRSIARPASGGTPFAEYLESEKKVNTLVRGASAASSIEGWYTSERRNGQSLEQPGEGGEGCEVTTGEQKANGPLHLTSVPLPSLTNPPAVRPSMAEQPEGSEMGDCGVASYESRGPRDDQQGTGQGDSSIYMPQFRAARSESGAGTNGDHEGDEVDNGDVEGKSYDAESSKHKRMSDSLAADQHSLGMAVSGSATAEGDTDAEVGNDRKNKRICIGPSTASASDRLQRPISFDAHDNSRSKSKKGFTALHENLRGMRRLTGEFPCSSSVNATDTCFQNKRENSMDSVEFMPHDDAQQHTAASGYTENEWLFDEPNSVAQAQQSTSYATGYVQRGITGDKSGDDDTNAAMISTGTATAGGGSVGMVGIGAVSRRVQSNEADIQGGYGADFSEHQTESVAGEAEVVIDAVEHQGHSGELGLVCDSTPLAVIQDDSHDAVLSLCPGVGQNSAKDLGDDSGESDSKASLRPRNRFPEEERTADTTNAVIVGGSLGTVTKEGTDGSMEAAVGDANSAPALGTAKESEDTHVGERQLGDFDPIRRHRSFCPWVNGLVLAAANGTFGTSAAVCGWQLTVDALDAFHMQEIPAGVTESESTASMCKSEELVLKQGSSSPKQCNGSSAYWDPK